MLCNETYKLSINCLNDYENCKKNVFVMKMIL